MDSADVEKLTDKWFCNECEHKKVKNGTEWVRTWLLSIIDRENWLKKDQKVFSKN
jgi:hypothetical protein